MKIVFMYFKYLNMIVKLNIFFADIALEMISQYLTKLKNIFIDNFNFKKSFSIYFKYLYSDDNFKTCWDN
jgi:hypothetical protein